MALEVAESAARNGGLALMRTLVIHGGAIGDFVLTLGLIQALRRWGARHVTLIGRSTSRELAVPACGIDAFFDLDAGGFHALFQDSAEPDARVRNAVTGHDLAIGLLGRLPAMEFQLRACGIPQIALIDPRPRDGLNRHITNQWADDLARAGIPVAPMPPRIPIAPADRDAARAELTRLVPGAGSPPVIVHPGSGSQTKCYPSPRMAALVDALRDAGLPRAILVGPAERERWSAGEAALWEASGPLLESTSLARVAAWLSQGAAFIGNDSGMTHLAAAVGAAVVAVFGPTDPAIWRPLSPRAVVVRAPGWSAPGDVLQRLRTFLPPPDQS